RKLKTQYKLVKQSDKEKGQDKNINLVRVESSKEEEVYVTCLQPYTKNQKKVKGKQKQSESYKEEVLQKKAKIQEEKDDLFYNPWLDDNPTAYLANSCEKDKISFNINKELEKEQFRQAENLLNENVHVFTQKISKKGQTVGLGLTDLLYYEINMEDARLIARVPSKRNPCYEGTRNYF
ncbi:38423_t:CDS:2, partial [Gigaspora margarita]